MPIYDFECPNCGICPDIWAKIAEVELKCPKCGKIMKRLISPSNIQCDYEYLDHNISATPLYIKSRQHRRQTMREKGLYEKG